MKKTPEEFFKTYAKIAIADSIHSGVPPSITLAQAALESGWGGSGLTTNANNFFGIKTSSKWKGPTYNASTHEYYSGSSNPTTVSANFRKYGSPYESFEDHSIFLQENPRYAALFKLDFLDYKGWAKGIKAAGYATSPDYSDKLIGLIQKYKLHQYDLKAENQRTLKKLANFALFISALMLLIYFTKKLF